MDVKQEWITKVSILALFVLLSQWNFSFAQNNIDLDWSIKHREGTINFLSAEAVENELKFDIVVQNTGEKYYECLFIVAGDKTVHIDDEMEEYPGIRVKFFKGANNKFAPKQRKRISLYIPTPSSEAETANVHFGFHFQRVSSTKSCQEPLREDYEFNFHMSDWNVSFIRK